MANEFKIDDKDFKRKMNKVKSNISTINGNIIKALAMRTIAKVKRYTPVKTGLLRRSWFTQNETSSNSGASVEIVNNVKYAQPVELGHSVKGKRFIAGRMMLTKSMREIEAQGSQIAEKEIKKFLD